MLFKIVLIVSNFLGDLNFTSAFFINKQASLYKTTPNKITKKLLPNLKIKSTKIFLFKKLIPPYRLKFNLQIWKFRIRFSLYKKI